MEVEKEQSYKLPDAVGIEIGGYKSLATALTTSGIESILNELSQAEILSVISFDQKQRLFSDHAYQQIKKNLKNTITCPSLYLGLYSQSEALLQMCSTAQNSQRFSFQVNYQGKPLQLSASQVLAAYINYLDKLIFAKLGSNNYFATVSIHNGSSFLQKKMLQNALTIADKTLAQLCEEQVAISYAYLWYKKHDLMCLTDKSEQLQNQDMGQADLTAHSEEQLQLQNQIHNVLFIDLGQSKLSVFLVEFFGLKARIKLSRTNQQLGIRNLDYLLLEHFKNKFPQLFSAQKSPEKARLRFLEAIQRHRKILSSNQETHILIENFTSTDDLEYVLTRNEFEQVMLEKFLNQITEVLQGVCLDLQQLKIDINEVQIMGGGCRIPIVKQLIQTMFLKQQLGVLMQSESISRGCTIQSGIFVSKINPQIRIEKYEVENCLCNPLTVTLLVNGQTAQVKTIDQYQQLPHSILFVYNFPEVPSSFSQLDIRIEINHEIVMSYRPKPGAAQKPGVIYNQVSIELQITNNCGMVEAASGKIRGRSADQTSVDEVDLVTSTEYLSDMSTEEINQAKDLEKHFKMLDEEVIELQNYSNDTESQIIQYKQLVNDKLKLYISPADQQYLTQSLESINHSLENLRQSPDFGMSQVKEIELQAATLMDKYIDLLQQKQQEIIQIHTIDELKNIQKIYQKKKISSISLNLRDKKINSGKLFGFMKSGSQQLKDMLSTISIEESVTLEIGNNNLTDENLKTILDGLRHNQRLKHIKIDMQSSLNSKTTNYFTDAANRAILSFLAQMPNIQKFELLVNKIFDSELLALTQILASKQNLGQVSLHVKNGVLSRDARKTFYAQMVQKLLQQNVEFIYFNEKGQQESA